MVGVSEIIDPATNAPVNYSNIEVQFPLNQFLIGEEIRLKRCTWRIADMRNNMGMILIPTRPTRTEQFWRVGELLPLKGYWYRVAVLGREGFVLAPKEPVHVDS